MTWALVPVGELLSWTDEQIEHAIEHHVPEGSRFVCEWRTGAWIARVEGISGDLASCIACEVENVDRRMALYGIYGHLWLREHPLPTRGSCWDSSAPRPTTVSVSRYIHSTLSDPEDVDPVEVSAVYGIPSTQKG